MSIDELVKKMYYLCISLVMSMVVIIELFRYILSESVARLFCLLSITKTFGLETFKPHPAVTDSKIAANCVRYIPDERYIKRKKRLF